MIDNEFWEKVISKWSDFDKSPSDNDIDVKSIVIDDDDSLDNELNDILDELDDLFD